MSIEDEIEKVVHEHGWFAANVFDGDPPFVYTIGLMETFDHPEFIVFGLEPNGSTVLIASIVEHMRAGERFDSKGVRTIRVGDDNHVIGLRKVDVTQHPLYMGYAMGYCRHIDRWGELSAVQVFWSDTRGRFPFDPGFGSEAAHLQPRLDIPLTEDEIADFERQFE